MSRRASRYAATSVASYADPDTNSEADESSDSLIIDLSSDEGSEAEVESVDEIEIDDSLLIDSDEFSDGSEEETYFSPNKARQPKKKPQKKAKHKRKQNTKNFSALQYTTDDVDEEHSITQGCFLVAPKKKTKKTAVTSRSLFNEILNGKEGEVAKRLRHEAYEYHWNILKKQLEEVRESVYNNTFENIGEFVHHSHNRKTNDTCIETLNEQDIWNKGGQMQLPTAVIIVGMNVLDHQRLLHDLVAHLEDESTLMVTLQSKDCSKPSHALFSLVSQCINHPQGHIDENQSIPTSRANANIRQLTTWYKTLCKAKKVPIGSITIGILLLDFECFTTEVAQLLVSVCSNHLHEIPFTFVIGIATSVSTIHQMLPRSVCSRLQMEKFRFLPPSQQLKLILQQIFLDKPPIIQLGFECLQVIFNRFEEANISIESFSRSVQFSFMEHFYKNPLSFMTLCIDGKQTKRILAALEPAHFVYIRSLPSVELALSKLEPAKAKFLRKNNPGLLQYISYWITQLVQSRLLFSVAFQCYASLPYFSNERKEYLHFLYLYAQHKEPMQRFHILRQTALKKRLKHCDVALHVLRSWKEILMKFPSHFEKVLPAIDQLEKGIRSQQEGPGSQLPQATCSKLRRFIAKFLNQFMKPCSQFPLHEAFCYNQQRPLQEAFTPQIQNVIRQSMVHPELFLGYIPPHHLPDTCIAFSFYEENGKRINLYDWYVQFSDSCRKQNDADITQARYLRALTELQLLGFIQPKNSNTAERCV